LSARKHGPLALRSDLSPLASFSLFFPFPVDDDDKVG